MKTRHFVVYHSKVQPQAPGCRLCSQRSTFNVFIQTFNTHIQLNDPGTGMTFTRILYDVAFGTIVITSHDTAIPTKSHYQWNSERITRYRYTGDARKIGMRYR
jgi:hypothetical protein